MLLHLLDPVHYSTSWNTRYRELKSLGALLPIPPLADHSFQSWVQSKIEHLDLEWFDGSGKHLDFLACFPRLRRLRVESSDHLFELAHHLSEGCGKRLEALFLNTDSQEGHSLYDWEENFNSKRFPRLHELVVMMDSCDFAPSADSEAITRRLEASLPDAHVLVSEIDESPCSISYGHRSQGGTGFYMDPSHDVFFPGLLEIWQTHPFVRGPLRQMQSKRDQRLAPLMHAAVTATPIVE